ncbi:MAG: polyphenol oxidase family protein [Treponema sp.]|jgi:YfiH family protein|nr:polyphenol oxidase family protein [Treponema sp.]
MRNNVSLYPFTLKFDGENGSGTLARFPFMFEGKPVRELSGGGPAPSCAISARSAGDMKFGPGPDIRGSARERFFRSLGIPGEKVYSLFQVHSRDVHVIGGMSSGPAACPPPSAFAQEGDGMVSFCRDVFLSVTVADCLPVFLLDTESGSFAALHSGWRGTGIALEAFFIMARAGTAPEKAAAVLGPCIQSCCYRVNEQRAAVFESEFGGENFPGPAAVYRNPRTASARNVPAAGWYLDMRAANIRLLSKVGIRHIAYCEDCTFTDERLGSFRREGQGYTRMAALAGPFR